MKKYTVRRAILNVMARLYCPLDLKSLVGFDEIIMLQDDAQVAIEWKELTKEHYLVEVPGFDDYRALSPKMKALFQADENRAFMRDDPFLAGPFAMR